MKQKPRPGAKIGSLTRPVRAAILSFDGDKYEHELGSAGRERERKTCDIAIGSDLVVYFLAFGEEVGFSCATLQLHTSFQGLRNTKNKLSSFFSKRHTASK